jgi:hypothetical protein
LVSLRHIQMRSVQKPLCGSPAQYTETLWCVGVNKKARGSGLEGRRAGRNWFSRD